METYSELEDAIMIFTNEKMKEIIANTELSDTVITMHDLHYYSYDDDESKRYEIFTTHDVIKEKREHYVFDNHLFEGELLGKIVDITERKVRITKEYLEFLKENCRINPYLAVKDFKGYTFEMKMLIDDLSQSLLLSKGKNVFAVSSEVEHYIEKIREQEYNFVELTHKCLQLEDYLTTLRDELKTTEEEKEKD